MGNGRKLWSDFVGTPGWWDRSWPQPKSCVDFFKVVLSSNCGIYCLWVCFINLSLVFYPYAHVFLVTRKASKAAWISSQYECMSVDSHSGDNICICIYTNNCTITFTSGRSQNSFETVFIICESRLMVFAKFELGKPKEHI